MMVDPEGNVCNVFTPLASHIADHPEQHLVTCTAQNTSPVSQASTEQFGDALDYPIRTAQDILESIEELETLADPDDFVHYEKIAREYQLNGVNKPFWRDCYLVNPGFLPNPNTYLTLTSFTSGIVFYMTIYCPGQSTLLVLKSLIFEYLFFSVELVLDTF